MPSIGKESSKLASDSPLDANQQDALARHALGELPRNQETSVEQLLNTSSKARAVDAENQLLTEVLPEPEANPLDSLSADLSQTKNSATTRNTLLTWRNLFPTAGLAGLLVGAGVWWAMPPADSTHEQSIASAPPAVAAQPSAPTTNSAPRRTLIAQSLTVSTPEPTPLAQIEKPVVVERTHNDPLLTLIEPPAPPAPDNLSSPAHVDTPAPEPVEQSKPAAASSPQTKHHSTAKSTPPAPAPEVAATTESATKSPELPPRRSTINLSQTGQGDFRPVPSAMQPVKDPVQLGFYVPELPVRNPAAPDKKKEPSLASTSPEGDLLNADQPTNGETAPPFTLVSEVVDSPWAPGRQLLLVGVRGQAPVQLTRAPANLVFLVDNSASMLTPDRLPLVREAMVRLMDQLGPEDRLGIVVYAGEAKKLLPSTPCVDRGKILDAIKSLEPVKTMSNGPSLALAYDMVRAHYLKNTVNRVVIVTDGDMNFGMTAQQGLMEYVENQARQGIGLSVIGVGGDFLTNSTWRSLAQLGQGTFARVSSLAGATRALTWQTQLPRSLTEAMKEVRVELMADAQKLKGYRLIGYENQWPKFLAGSDTITKDHHIYAVYEVERLGAEQAAASPLQLRASYREDGDKALRVVTKPIPTESTSSALVSQAFQKVLSRADEQYRLWARQEAERQKLADSQQSTAPNLVQNLDADRDGKIKTEDLRLLEERAKSWIEAPAR